MEGEGGRFSTLSPPVLPSLSFWLCFINASLALSNLGDLGFLPVMIGFRVPELKLITSKNES